MADVLEVDPYANGGWILVFDGRVLEIFGDFLPNTGIGRETVADSWRVHIKQLTVKAAGPNTKGYHEVEFSSRARPDGVKVTQLNETQWGRLQPFLETLAKATAGAAAPASGSDELLATKTSSLQALLSEHGARLSLQPEDVRSAVVSDLQASGVPIDPESLTTKMTDPGQVDTMFEVYQRHGLIPADATLG